MSEKLNAQQEHFCRAIVEGLSQYDAYREAFPQSLKWQRQSVDVKASQLAAQDKVKIRIASIRAPVIRKLQYGLEEAMEEALRAYDLAASTEQVGAMVAAAQLRAKLQGLLVERKEIKITKFDDLDANKKTEAIEVLSAEIARRKALAGPDQLVTDVEPKDVT